MAITKKNVLEALNTINFTDTIMVGDVSVTPDDIKDYIEKSLIQLENKAGQAAKRAEKTKAAGEEVKNKIKAVLGETPMTVTEVVAALNDPEVTNAKVIARASQLVKDGEIYKGKIKTEDKRELVVYATSPIATED